MTSNDQGASENTKQMKFTLWNLLTFIGFAQPIIFSIDVGRRSGIIGSIVGLGVGLPNSVFAIWAMYTTADYLTTHLQEKHSLITDITFTIVAYVEIAVWSVALTLL